jgi:hypothetical protein
MQTYRPNELAQTRLDYWNELVKYMKRRNSPIVFNDPNPPHQLRATAGALGSGEFILVAQAIVRPHRLIGVGVEISGSKEYYLALKENQFRIQNEIGLDREDKQKFEWNPDTNVRDLWLYWYVDFLDRRLWSQQHEWLCDKLHAFQKALKPRISNLL